MNNKASLLDVFLRLTKDTTEYYFYWMNQRYSMPVEDKLRYLSDSARKKLEKWVAKITDGHGKIIALMYDRIDKCTNDEVVMKPNSCPYCEKDEPQVRYDTMGNSQRVECDCGVSGPWEFNEKDAIRSWDRFIQSFDRS